MLDFEVVKKPASTVLTFQNCQWKCLETSAIQYIQITWRVKWVFSRRKHLLTVTALPEEVQFSGSHTSVKQSGFICVQRNTKKCPETLGSCAFRRGLETYSRPLYLRTVKNS